MEWEGVMGVRYEGDGIGKGESGGGRWWYERGMSWAKEREGGEGSGGERDGEGKREGEG